MTTRRIGATALLLLLASLAVGLVLAGPAGAGEPGPAYPPGAGADDVVQTGGTGSTAPAGATDDGGSAGHDPAAASDGAGGADGSDTEVGEPATAERPDDESDEGDGEGDEGDGDDEVAADGQDASDTAAPGGGRGAGPILIVVGTAVLLGGAVVAIARRI
ncbi:MAG TPA: hypothetical protein VF228_14480 [Iamia sp.]